MTTTAIVSRIENDRVLVLERVFDAPRELVFQMYKDPEHLRHWWGPKGWDLPVCKMDFRPGGEWHYCMKCVDQGQGEFFGMESWGKQVFKDIVEPETIVYTDYFTDAEGNVNPDLPATDGELQFIDLGGKTKVICRSTYATPESLKTVLEMGMMEGIAQTYDRLAERLASLQ